MVKATNLVIILGYLIFVFWVIPLTLDLKFSQADKQTHFFQVNESFNATNATFTGAGGGTQLQEQFPSFCKDVWCFPSWIGIFIGMMFQSSEFFILNFVFMAFTMIFAFVLLTDIIIPMLDLIPFT